MRDSVTDRRTALTLAETVIALFLLSGAALACLSLLSQARRNQHLTLQVLQANRFGRTCLERVRAWGNTGNNFANWASYADQTFSDPEFPELKARVQAAPAYLPVISPNSSLEAPMAPNLRALGGSAEMVKITVAWAGGNPAPITFQTLVAAPLRAVATSPPLMQLTRLSGSPSPMAVNATAIYKVALLDSAGQPIDGIIYRWSIEGDYSSSPETPGMGSLEVLDRVGDRAALIHHFYDGDPDIPTNPGDIVLRCYCRYGGRELVYASDRITLSP